VRRRPIPVVVAALACATVVGCAGPPAPPAGPAEGPVTAATTALPATPPAHPAGRLRPAASAPVAAGTALLPDRMADTGGARQLVVVTSTGPGAPARLEAYQLAGHRWRRALPPIPAVIGADGFSSKVSESTRATPIGFFSLTEAFGTAANPGAALPYRRTRPGDVWVDDPASPYYNTRQTDDADFSKGRGERLWLETSAYEYAIVIDYNRRPVVPGAGSAFFLHVSVPVPSQGCVTVARPALLALLRWLDPAAHPRVALGPLAAVLRL
jgi:L,D-peptidoglycan transpeptidase YkuD (ErfK/YbiS/YcfS/YnhG family)